MTILSFHPIIEAHENIICAGRQPNADDLAAIRRAEAVILPQGCAEPLYRMARDNCRHIFPNLDVRFDYPGKCGQIRLFRKLGVSHPATGIFDSVPDFHRRNAQVDLPAVVKLNWGGQGDTVFKARTQPELNAILDRIEGFEQSGPPGFLIQTFIPHRRRSLRVALMGRRTVSYWRIQAEGQSFGDSVAGGACIDHEADPPQRSAAEDVVRAFCHRTGLQLAGFDFLFDEQALARGRIEPLMLEINYFFGRTGLGGSEAYYQILTGETDAWLAGLGLSRQ